MQQYMKLLHDDLIIRTGSLLHRSTPGLEVNEPFLHYTAISTLDLEQETALDLLDKGGSILHHNQNKLYSTDTSTRILQ